MPIRTMDATARRIVNINTGYDQNQRFTFNPSRDGRTFVAGREADCSSFCAAVVKSAYPRLDMRDPIYTGNLKTRFEAVGFRAIRYKNLAQLRAGDFVLSPGYHVEYVHSDGRMYSAAIDERGRLRGGRAGNQTGLETRATRKYVYSKGWRWILRPPTTRTATSTPKPKGSWFTMATPAELRKIVKEEIRIASWAYRGKANKDAWAILREIQSVVKNIRDNSRVRPWLYKGAKDPRDMHAVLKQTDRNVAAIKGTVDGLVEAVKQIDGVDPAEIGRVVNEGVTKALNSLEADVSLNISASEETPTEEVTE